MNTAAARWPGFWKKQGRNIRGRISPPLFDAGRVRLRTLVNIRWLAILGQLLAVLIVHFLLGYPLAFWPLLAVIGASVLLNAYLQSTKSGAGRRLSEAESALQLGYDLLQLSVLLYLTGGLGNPFSILMLAPVTISATILSRKITFILLGFAVAALALLAFRHQPLPWRDGPLVIPTIYLTGIGIAILLSMIFLALYASRVSSEARRRATALAATQAALAREQKLSALGSLAAAAAHELGTPLGTITLAARELSRGVAKGGPYGEEVATISEQADRCREILARLAKIPEGGDNPFARQSPRAFFTHLIQPFDTIAGTRFDLKIDAETDKAGKPILIPSTPEIVHGLGNFVENAARFALSKITIYFEADGDQVKITLLDDGPGFDLSVIKMLGEPYIGAACPAEDKGRTTKIHQGMGLGIFIAKTLLERTGAILYFDNETGGGAKVVCRWRRINWDQIGQTHTEW